MTKGVSGIESLVRKLTLISSVEVPRAGSSALNKLSAKVKTRVVRGVSKKTNIQQKFIRRKVYIKRSTARTLRARIKFYRGAVSVISMSPRQNRRGVRAGKHQFDGAFKTTTRRGQAQVFRRKGRARLPLEVVKIPIQKQVDEIAPVVTKRLMASEFKALLITDLNHRLKKYGR